MQRFLRRLIDPVDRSLDNITSFRLVLYVLRFILVWSVGLAFFDLLPFTWYEISLSALLLVCVCWSASYLFARQLNISRNFESDFITALILTFILNPADSLRDFAILAAVGFIAMASKYVLVLGRRHIFNPAAFGALSAGLFFDYYPSWWIGTTVLTPIVLIGGLLILRKMKRFIMSGLFLIIYILVLAARIYSDDSIDTLWHNVWLALTATPLLFFSIVMLTEPMTSPYSLQKYIPYVLLVGILYSVHELRLAPEEALLIGNILAYLMAPDRRHRLMFKERKKEAKGIYSFLFKPDKPVRFKPGQFLEWTIASNATDVRGNRRYFTISSSPTEEELMLTVKVPEEPSSFKKRLHDFKSGDSLLASHLAGTFTLPKNPAQKLAFIAGGIGVTPFRSIAKYMVDQGQSRNAIMLYGAKELEEFAFTPLFDKAEALGFKTFRTITDLKEPPPNWTGYVGTVDKKLIKKAIPDYKERVFYLSGPYGFVQSVLQQLLSLGISRRQIKLDYFPGYG